MLPRDGLTSADGLGLGAARGRADQCRWTAQEGLMGGGVSMRSAQSRASTKSK